MAARPVPAPFTISDAAVRKIGWIREQYREAFPDNPPVMPGVSLGQRLFDNGRRGPKQVFIAFWRASEFPPQAYDEVQRVSGVDLIFKVLDEDVPDFVGKQIDYAPDQAFFLRDAPA
jgi:hypothetical protein